MRVWGHWEFLNYPFRWNLGLSEVSKHLSSCGFGGAVRSSNLNCVVYRFVPLHRLNIGRHLAIFKLMQLCLEYINRNNQCLPAGWLQEL